jgi:RNA polymerase sigma-70 factor (ECF subfamily)
MGTSNGTKTVTEGRAGPDTTADEQGGEDQGGKDQAGIILRVLGKQEIPTADLKRDREQAPGDELRAQILALYDEFRPRLYRYMRSMHLGREHAEEVIQETFMRFATKRLEGCDIENEQGWVVRVAHNLALDLLKRERKAGVPAEGLNLLIENRADPALSPEDMYLQKEQFEIMKKALSGMKPQHRYCFHLRVEGLHYKDIGTTLGISEQRAAFIVKQVAMQLAAICG